MRVPMREPNAKIPMMIINRASALGIPRRVNHENGEYKMIEMKRANIKGTRILFASLIPAMTMTNAAKDKINLAPEDFAGLILSAIWQFLSNAFNY